MSDTEDLSNNGLPASETRAPRVSSSATLPYGTEARIASMEAHVDHMRDDLGDMRRDYRELTKTIVSSGNDMRGLDDRIQRQAGIHVQFGREPDFGVDHVVRRKVFDAFERHPVDGLRRLHDRDGVRERRALDREQCQQGEPHDASRLVWMAA